VETKQVNIRLATDDVEQLNVIAARCEVTTAALAGFFLRAALRACKSHPGRILLPPDFQIVEESTKAFAINEPKPKTSYTRK